MKVLQLIDSLNPGGAERMAVNLANALSSKVDQSFLCTTREEGILKESLGSNVKYLFLRKNKTLDIFAINRLNRFIKKKDINIVHAHSSSFFLATIIKLLNKKVKLVWHDHYGNSEFLNDRKSRILAFCSRFFSHVFSVNKQLELWGKKHLRVNSVSYLPNFVVENQVQPETVLFGKEGKRIVCLANFRHQKDHITLINAFKLVVEKHPEWTLHCVGKDFKDNYSSLVKGKIKTLKLNNQVYLYDSKSDIANILNQCEIGVLSSKSEGLPLALLEYGLAGLAVIATKVGECERVLESGKEGVIVNPGDINQLKLALQSLINNTYKREEYANNFFQKVSDNYSSDTILKSLLNIYKTL